MCAISINSYDWDSSESEGKRPKLTPLPHMRLLFRRYSSSLVFKILVCQFEPLFQTQVPTHVNQWTCVPLPPVQLGVPVLPVEGVSPTGGRDCTAGGPVTEGDCLWERQRETVALLLASTVRLIDKTGEIPLCCLFIGVVLIARGL